MLTDQSFVTSTKAVRYKERNHLNNEFLVIRGNILLDVLLCSIAEYFYQLRRILTSP